MVDGIPYISVHKEVCEHCQAGKQHQEAFSRMSVTKSTKILELPHIELCGPFPITSPGGSDCIHSRRVETNCNLLDMAHNMTTRAITPSFLWIKSVNTATFILNQSPTKALLEYQLPHIPRESWPLIQPSNQAPQKPLIPKKTRSLPPDHTIQHNPAHFASSTPLEALPPTDVKTPFLYGDLKESVYMEVPEGFRDTITYRKICRLKKSLYGLKQAPCTWSEKINTFLDNHGLSRSNSQKILWIKTEPMKRFEMSDPENINYYLGVEFIRHPKETFFSHLLTEFVPNPILLFYDSQSTLQSARNPFFHDKSKPMEMWVHYI
uniref:Reverse transcriptase Ty1/copia-type domain-containing protein n=1 Tax=Physcomitrium patens TaxID=3218 RepID=A0A7I4DLP2_PHYPA